MKTIELLQNVADFLAHHKGLPVLVGVGLVLLNFILRLLPAWPVVGWLASVDLFMHLGIIIGLMGVLIGDAL